MADYLQSQIDQLRASIAGLEAQRSLLGEAIVNPLLAAAKQQLASLEEQVAREAAPAEERRMVTILFTDMVGSTSRAEKLDPEEWRQIVARMQTVLGDAITAHRGTIAQYLGDGLLAFFGAKEASESDPENAIRAALDGQTAVANLLAEDQVQVRAGIHTGLVVVGDLGAEAHKEFTASGDAVNLAARLQSAAPPGGVLISHDTYRYVRGIFDLTPRPPLTVKGKAEPLQTYLVRRAKPRPFHTVARGVAGIEVPTIGRETELAALQSAYRRAYEGHGTTWAQLIAEPGVGKSRVLAEMDDWMDLREETFRLLRARAFPDDASQPYALVRRMWFDRFQIAEDAPLEQAETRWVERFRELYERDDFEEPAHALGLLVGLPFEGSPHIKGMRNDPTQVKGRALVVSRELMQAIRRELPAVVMLEDLQWADPASWDYLMEVLLTDDAERQDNGLFILAAARPEWTPPKRLSDLFETSQADGKGTRAWGVMIPLAPLTDAATRELAHELLKPVADLPETVIDLLVERSEGVPYFVEEMVNWFVDHGILDTHTEPWRFLPERLKEQPLPATLQHLLLTRLSSLSQPERSALQRGAIFGRRFWTGGVEALGVAAGSEVLAHLQPRGFVDAQAESAFQGDEEWSFRQNLLHEVTYESVLKRERAALHKVAAEWLEQQARKSGRLDEFAGLLGDHCLRAGELSQAADWYLRAGRTAFGQGAPREAKRFYTQALDLLPPVDRQRRWQGLLLREEALSVLADVEDWKADVAALVELAGTFEDDNYLAEAYLRQTIFGWRAGDMNLSARAAPEALAAARRCGNEAIEAKALSGVATMALPRGDLEACIRGIDAAVALARRLGDESVLAYVLVQASFCYGEMGDFATAAPLQTEQIELDHRLGNRDQETRGINNLASGYISLGLFKQARALLEQGRSITESMGARRGLAYMLLNLGDTYRETGDLRKGRLYKEQALAEMSRTGDARGKGATLTELAQIVYAMGDAAGAARRFAEAQELGASQGLDGLRAEAAVGQAACAVMLGQPEEARQYIHEAWAYISQHGTVGMSGVGRVFQSCAETFDALGETENVQAVLEKGHGDLMNIAEKITNPEWRQSFLQNVPGNRAVMEMWERRKV